MNSAIGNILKRPSGLMFLVLKEIKLKQTNNLVCTIVSKEPYIATDGIFTVLQTEKSLYYHVPAIGILTKDIANELQLIDQITDTKVISSLLCNEQLIRQLAAIVMNNS